MTKQNQYQRILAALRKAGAKGLTTKELAEAVQSNCIWRRVSEMPIWHVIAGKRFYIDRHYRLINSRRVTVYRLRQV